ANGASAIDTSGNGATGTLLGGVSRVLGKVGTTALNFDGIDGHVAIPDNPALRFTASQSFSLSAWVYIPTLPNRNAAIFSKSTDVYPNWGLRLTSYNYWVFSSSYFNVYGGPAS